MADDIRRLTVITPRGAHIVAVKSRSKPSMSKTASRAASKAVAQALAPKGSPALRAIRGGKHPQDKHPQDKQSQAQAHPQSQPQPQLPWDGVGQAPLGTPERLAQLQDEERAKVGLAPQHQGSHQGPHGPHQGPHQTPPAPDYMGWPDILADLPKLTAEWDHLKEQEARVKARLDELKEEILVRMITVDQKSVQCLKYRVTKAAGCNVTLQAKRLLELGVDADTIKKAEKRTPYDYIVVTDTTKPKKEE